MPPAQTTRQVYVFDSAVPDLETLIGEVRSAQSESDPFIIVLDAGSDGVLQLADALAGQRGLDAIHVFSHGSVGSLYLGAAVLDQGSLANYRDALGRIGEALRDSGDLLLYGCNVAQGGVGRAFVEQLAWATGADVGASTDLTGAAGLGGDWMLERSTGVVDVLPTLSDYYGLLSSISANSKFNYSDALIAALFSDAAYVHGGDVPEIGTLAARLSSMKWSPLLTGTGGNNQFDAAGGYQSGNSYGFAAKTVEADGTVRFVLSFEGTNGLGDPADWYSTNLVEYGWSNAYVGLMPLATEFIRQALEEKFINQKKVELIITGHSLGGAIAQVAIADLLLPVNDNFWVDAHAPLKSGSRIYDQSALAARTAEQIRSLLTDTSVYTFGAPSMLTEPTKPDGPQWAAILGAPLATAIVAGPVAGALIGAEVIALGAAHAVDVNDSLLNSLLSNTNSALTNYIFQFEHNDPFGGSLGINDFPKPDPVAKLGTRDPGSELDIDLSEEMIARYGDLFGFPSMHNMEGYIESILRIMTDSSLLDTAYGGTDVVLSRVAYGGTGNDLIVDAPNGTGNEGNDVIIATSAAALSMLPGTGRDSLVIKGTGINVTIDGPLGEAADDLYFFARFGDVSVDDVAEGSESLVIRFTDSANLVNTVVLPHWYAKDSSYQLASISQIQPFQSQSWVVKDWDFRFLEIPLLNVGTIGNDTIIGSSSGDHMTGGGGDDTMRGRGGIDSIEGGDGRDELYGGAANDTIRGGPHNDVLDGGTENDSLFGDAGNDTLKTFDGGDTLDGGADNDTFIVQVPVSGIATVRDASGTDEVQVVASTANYLMTRFFADGNDLKIEVRASLNSTPLATVTVANMAAVGNRIETLRVSQGNDTFFNFDLTVAWNAVTAVIPDSTGGAAFQGSTTGGYYNGDGDDTINIVGGSRTVYAGGGADTVNVAGAISVVVVDGEAGRDTLNLDGFTAGGNRNIAFGVQNAESNWSYFGMHFPTSSAAQDGYPTASLSQVKAVLEASPVLFQYGFSTSNASVQSVQFKGMEVVNAKGGANVDFLVYQKGTEYVGGAQGPDTFYADWSDWTEAVVWTNAKNTASSIYADDSVATLGAVHQVKVSGMERLLIQTGSGNDTIVQNVTNTDDEFRMGAGDDSLALNGLSTSQGGSDTVDMGAGNDTLTVSGSSASDVIVMGTGDDTVTYSGILSGTVTIDGGTDTGRVDRDTLNLDGFTAGGNRNIAFGVQNAELNWSYFGMHFPTSSATQDGYPTASLSQVKAVLEASPVQFQYGFSTANASVQSVQFKGMEVVNAKGGANVDFLVYQKGTEYVGGAQGPDTFYADWSDWTEAVVWTNAKNTASSIYADDSVATLGAVHQVKVSGMERLLIQTGSGNDTIVQNVTNTDDEFRMGAGDDSLALNGLSTSQGGSDTVDMGAGNDTLTVSGSSASDVIVMGTGDDTVTYSGILSGTVTIDGGTDTGRVDRDTLNLDGFTAGGNRNIAFGVQNAELNWSYFGMHFPTSSATQDGYPTASLSQVKAVLEASPVLFQYGFSTSNASVQSVQFKGMEVVNAKGGANVDFLVYQKGTEYVGGAQGPDTFYADWSDWTEAVVWTNAKNTASSIYADDSVATLGAVHQVKVSGMERLLIQTGSGNDKIVQNVTNTDDEFRMGAGDDSLALNGLSTSQGGSDTVDMGAGNDTLTVSGSSASDVIVMGTGDDTVTYSGILSGTVTIDGGTDTGRVDRDTLNLDGFTAGGNRNIAFGVQNAELNWSYFGMHFPTSSATQDGYPTASLSQVKAVLEASPVQFQYGFSTANASVQSVQFKGMEVVNAKGGANVDFLVYQKGTEYVGGAQGPDTFYADWSDWTEAVVWTNAKNTASSIYADDSVATLGAVHQVKVSGMERLLIQTGSGNDTIVQNVTNTDDEFRMGAGDDFINAGAGTDTMLGGTGNDFYVIDTLADLVTELVNEGTDTIETAITYTLAALANVENLTLTGAAAINGTGNGANNLLLGNTANNNLNAGLGNDTLNGGAGNDTLVGGGGDDTYVVDSVGDVLTELANEGLDTVQTSLASLSLAQLVNIENITYTGALAFAVIGNAAANSIFGGAGDDSLDGGEGNDSLNGGVGFDTLLGGAGNDTLNGANNADRLYGGAGDDTLYGGKSADLLDGGDGDDMLYGQIGNDSLYGGNGADTIDYAAGDAVTVNLALLVGGSTVPVVGVFNGTDTLQGIENVVGSAFADNISGDLQVNVLTGGAGNDTLSASDGADTLFGSEGNDVISGGAGGDSILGGIGNDLISGGKGGDRVFGDDGDDTLNGNLGNDQLTGGAGADKFLFSSVLDVVTNVDTILDFDAGVDIIQLSASIFGAFSGQIGQVIGIGANLLYDTGSGFLAYDVDGVGGAASINFAIIGAGVHPLAMGGDFLVVA